MRSTGTWRLAMCQRVRDCAPPPAVEVVNVMPLSVAEPSELTPVLDELKTIRQLLERADLGAPIRLAVL